MSQIVALAPDHDALGGALFCSQRSLGIDLGLIGTDERDAQIQHGAALDDESDASQQAVDFPVSTETVAIDQRQALRLLYQFVVLHDFPRRGPFENHDRIAKGVHRKCDAGLHFFPLLCLPNSVEFVGDPLPTKAAPDSLTTDLPGKELAPPNNSGVAA